MPFNTQQRTVMDELYAKSKSCRDDAKLVQIIYQMIKLCLEADEAYVQQIPPKSVGIHPANRSGKFMKDTKMQKKGYKIFKVGFALQLCKPEKAVAFEDHKKECESHTLKITRASKMFGQYREGSVRVGSVGCSHLSQWLHAGGCGAETPYNELCDPGKTTMNKAIVAADNEELEKAINFGIEWTVMKTTLVYDYGYDELPSLFQRGLNVEHHVGEGAKSCSRFGSVR